MVDVPPSSSLSRPHPPTPGQQGSPASAPDCAAGQKPRVSFVIATYNRGPVLVECLRETLRCGVAELADQGGWEVLVVDNASTDGTADLLAQALPEVRLIRLAKNEGPVAKNYGIAQARGELVFFLDDDAYPFPGTLTRMLGHFARDARLGAAVCNVTLPDGSQECSAYPNVCIGAGTGFRKAVLDQVGYLPADFFMAAEEYDLSFRILRAGFAVRRFEDLPLRHLKTPHARIGQRITELDVRNNLFLLARYLPAPLCYELAGDWLSRYWMMALRRDATGGGGSHRGAFLKGAAAGLAQWSVRRYGPGAKRTQQPTGTGHTPHTPRHLPPAREVLEPTVIEQIFKFHKIRDSVQEAQQRRGFRRVLLADFGKNMLGYAKAMNELKMEVAGIVDDNLASLDPNRPHEYRGWPLMTWEKGRKLGFEAIIISNMSPVHARKRAALLGDLTRVPVVNVLESPAFITE